MQDLARILRRGLRTPVWDRTGIAGRFDFEFRYAGESAGATVEAPWVGTALEETLGLRFVKQRGTVESIVVDSIEEPTAN